MSPASNTRNGPTVMVRMVTTLTGSTYPSRFAARSRMSAAMVIALEAL